MVQHDKRNQSYRWTVGRVLGWLVPVLALAGLLYYVNQMALIPLAVIFGGVTIIKLRSFMMLVIVFIIIILIVLLKLHFVASLMVSFYIVFAIREQFRKR